MIKLISTAIKLGGEVLFELLFPKFCVGCGRLDTYLCQRCLAKIDFYTLPIIIPNLDMIELITAMARYSGVTKKLITELKYAGIREVGATIAQLLYDTVLIPSVDAITAIPLHPDKLRQRGFNQTEIIGRQLAKLSNVPYHPLLIKTKSTVAQASLTDRRQRLKQLHHCFALNPAYTGELPIRVLLIDDVITTGATLTNCAHTLTQAGVQQVFALTVAHGT